MQTSLIAPKSPCSAIHPVLTERQCSSCLQVSWKQSKQYKSSGQLRVPMTLSSLKVCKHYCLIESSQLTRGALGDKLNGLWGTYYPVLWNSQQFAARLSYLILQRDSLATARTVLRRLLVRLANSAEHFLAAKNLGCGVAVTGFAIATFGVGALVACAIASGTTYSHNMKKNVVRARIADLEEAFPRLADIEGLSSFHKIHI
jgi:hypothetical protein